MGCDRESTKWCGILGGVTQYREVLATSRRLPPHSPDRPAIGTIETPDSRHVRALSAALETSRRIGIWPDSVQVLGGTEAVRRPSTPP
jgi:hypothetical protein